MVSQLFLDDNGKAKVLPKGVKAAFRPAVYMFVKNSQNEVLLIHNNGSKKWEIPGGGLEIGEDLVECAIREVKEETGFDVIADSEAPAYIKKDLSVGSEDNYEHGLIFYYTGKLKSEKKGKQHFAKGEKILDVQFFPIDELKDVDVVWWQKDIVTKFVRDSLI